MASRTALGNDGNSRTSTSPENREAFPPSEHSGSSRSWVFTRGVGLWESGRRLLCFFRFSCTFAFVLWLLLLQGQPSSSSPTWPSRRPVTGARGFLRVGSFPQVFAAFSSCSSKCQQFILQNQRQPSLACSTHNFISYPPLLLIAPHPAD